MVAKVIQIHPIHHQRPPGGGRDGLEVVMQLPLAGKTAVGGIAAVVGIVELAG